MAWLYLFIAAVFETAWIFSLKYIEWKKLVAIKWLSFFNSADNMTTVIPLIGYIVFGILNIIFFSLAMKQIAPATAFAVWMGASLIGIKLVEISVLKEPYDFQQLIYFTLILIGIVGLKRAGT